MASGMARSHRGFAGTVGVLSAGVATVRSGGGDVNAFARATSAGTSTRRRPRRLWPRLVGCASVSPAGAGGSGPAGGLRVAGAGGRGHGDLDGHVAASAARGPRGATSSSTSAGRPPDPSWTAAAEGGRFLGERPCTADQHVSQTNVCDTEDEAGSGLTERLSGSRLRRYPRRAPRPGSRAGGRAVTADAEACNRPPVKKMRRRRRFHAVRFWGGRGKLRDYVLRLIAAHGENFAPLQPFRGEYTDGFRYA